MHQCTAYGHLKGELRHFREGGRGCHWPWQSCELHPPTRPDISVSFTLGLGSSGNRFEEHSKTKMSCQPFLLKPTKMSFLSASPTTEEIRVSLRRTLLPLWYLRLLFPIWLLLSTPFFLPTSIRPLLRNKYIVLFLPFQFVWQWVYSLSSQVSHLTSRLPPGNSALPGGRHQHLTDGLSWGL